MAAIKSPKSPMNSPAKTPIKIIRAYSPLMSASPDENMVMTPMTGGIIPLNGGGFIPSSRSPSPRSFSPLSFSPRTPSPSASSTRSSGSFSNFSGVSPLFNSYRSQYVIPHGSLDIAFDDDPFAYKDVDSNIALLSVPRFSNLNPMFKEVTTPRSSVSMRSLPQSTPSSPSPSPVLRRSSRLARKNDTPALLRRTMRRIAPVNYKPQLK